MSNAHRFTPKLTNGRRLECLLSDNDIRCIKRGDWQATVTDLNTGLQLNVEGADCNLPGCKCDAVVINTDDYINHERGNTHD